MDLYVQVMQVTSSLLKRSCAAPRLLLMSASLIARRYARTPTLSPVNSLAAFPCRCASRQRPSANLKSTDIQWDTTCLSH